MATKAAVPKAPVVRTTLNKKVPLPVGIVEEDLYAHEFSIKEDRALDKLGISYDKRYLHLWRTLHGWMIPTLLISGGPLSRTGARTYAIMVDDDGSNPDRVNMIGNGPHVLEKLRIYLRSSRYKDLKKFLDLYDAGMIRAGNYRDQLSTKRANTRIRNARFSRW